MPLRLLSGAQRALASPSGAVVVGIGVSALFITGYFVLRRLTSSGWRALALTSAAAILFWHGLSISATPGAATWLVNVLIAGLVLGAAFRFARHRLFKLGVFVGSVTLGATMLLLVAIDSMTTPEPVVETKNPIGEVTLQSTPDIYLVVLDGYARSDVLEDLYQFDNSQFLGELTDEGFQVAENSSANYTVTHLALPSLLEMSYLNEPLDYMHNSDLEALARVTSGENTLVRVLQDAGYVYVHGDSDHWFNTCGSTVDICLQGPLLDVTGHSLLTGTPIGDLFYPTSGDPTTALNRTRIEQMAEWSQLGPEVDAPMFAFLHLILPHPPLFLDSSCQPRVEAALGGRILNDGPMNEERLAIRKAAWIEQLKCANTVILDFLDEIGEDDVVVLTSDHGPDSVFFIESTDPDDLTEDLLAERLPNLTAVRMPDACDRLVPADVHAVNLFRVILGCLSDSHIDMLDNRYFAASFSGSIIELKYADSPAD